MAVVHVVAVKKAALLLAILRVVRGVEIGDVAQQDVVFMRSRRSWFHPVIINPGFDAMAGKQSDQTRAVMGTCIARPQRCKLQRWGVRR